MAASKHEAAVAQLSSCDPAERLRALKYIKNSVIGNRTKKELYVTSGAVPRLIHILSGETSESLQDRVQAAIVLGSLAHGAEENITVLVAAGALKPLLTAFTYLGITEAAGQFRFNGTHAESGIEATSSLSSGISITTSFDSKLVEASARALKAIYSSPKVTKDDVFEPSTLRSIISLLSLAAQAVTDTNNTSWLHIAELVSCILARACDTVEHQAAIAHMGGVNPLVMLLTCGFAKAQEAALDALASLCRENSEIGKIVANTKVPNQGTTMDVMLRLVKDKCPSMRLLAATCLTSLYRDNVLTDATADIKHVVLPTLVKLLKEPGVVQERAPLVLADLVKDSDAMQRAAFEAEGVPNLVRILESVAGGEMEVANSPLLDKVKENTLVAIAAICLHQEDCRTQAISSKVLPHIETAMFHNLPSVRLAACQCAKSLSRSVMHLRTSLVDAGLVTPLLKLLSDESILVQGAACGALCNIVLDFSPMKKMVIENNGLDSFISFTHSQDFNLRLNGIWALKNLLYQADWDTKQQVMSKLTWQYLQILLNDPDGMIQEQALSFVRNLVAKASEQDMDAIFEGFGHDGLMDILESRLYVKGEAAKLQIVAPTLWTISNLAVGNDKHKAAITNRPNILKAILRYMDDPLQDVRVATCWIMINLSYADMDKMDFSAETIHGRIKQLRQMGFEKKLESLVHDSSQDVRDRAKTATAQFAKIPKDEDDS